GRGRRRVKNCVAGPRVTRTVGRTGAGGGRGVTRTSRPLKPIRVCFLIDRMTRGGTETQLLALIRAVDRARVAPALVLLDGTDAESRSLEPADCPVLRLGLRSLHRPGALAAAAKLTRFWR